MPDVFTHFAELLEEAIRRHYVRLMAALPGQVYGYSLYTGNDVSSIGPVANRSGSIQVGPEDPLYCYYRYGPQEWSEFDDFGLFAAANAELKRLYGSLDFEVYRNGALRASVAVLSALESEGLFGPRSKDRYIALWLADSDDPCMGETVRALNHPEVYAEYASEYGHVS